MHNMPPLNPEFPACAYAARRLLAEVYGCKPGDTIPGEAELIARAREIRGSDDGKASYALAMVEEIGGLFGHEGRPPRRALRSFRWTTAWEITTTMISAADETTHPVTRTLHT